MQTDQEDQKTQAEGQKEPEKKGTPEAEEMEVTSHGANCVCLLIVRPKIQLCFLFSSKARQHHNFLMFLPLSFILYFLPTSVSSDYPRRGQNREEV